jgi:hypothetical protein
MTVVLAHVPPRRKGARIPQFRHCVCELEEPLQPLGEQLHGQVVVVVRRVKLVEFGDAEIDELGR